MYRNRRKVIGMVSRKCRTTQRIPKRKKFATKTFTIGQTVRYSRHKWQTYKWIACSRSKRKRNFYYRKSSI